jgi:hydroxypyruvate isomerase
MMMNARNIEDDPAPAAGRQCAARAPVTRRHFLASIAALAGTVAVEAAGAHALERTYPVFPPLKGRLRQGLTPNLFESSIEETCRMAVSLGIRGLDFVSNPDDWPTLKRYGLTMSLLRVDHGGGESGPGRPLEGPPGWNAIGTPDQDGVFAAALHDRIDAAAANGIPNIIVTCGVRGKIGYDEGKRNAVNFLAGMRSHAEARGVTLVLENINSGYQGGPPDPPGSMFDHLPWGLDVVERINSPRVKLLVDLYHAQLMDGNVADFIRKHIQWIGHFHTGGTPGRHEIDETQELNYRFIAKTIAKLGYQGFISHEWSPSAGQDKLASIRKSMDVIDV